MRMKAGIGKTFALVLSKEATVAENNMINFIARAFAIETMPFLRRLLAFPVKSKTKKINIIIK